jgi:hypothetical protein
VRVSHRLRRRHGELRPELLHGDLHPGARLDLPDRELRRGVQLRSLELPLTVELFCACPFTVASLAWEPAAGQRSASVCVKATFVLTPGTSTIAPVQDPIRAEAAAGDAPDLVPYKPRAEILFVGHAHAPNGGLADSLLARARIGPWRKSLSINGDRTWVPSFEGLRPSVPVPFRRMPLTYERAVRTGENIVGVDISQGAEPNRPLANIAAIADQGGETPGLSAIPFGWRARRLGLNDSGILWASRAGLASGPPPRGFDFRVFNAAPSEQQLDELAPGLEVFLENLHPQHAQLETRLPAIRVRIFQRSPRTDASIEVPVRLDTITIDADRGLAIALWRGAVQAPDAATRVVVVAEAEGERLTIEHVDRMLAQLAPAAIYVADALARGSLASHPPIPDPIPLPAGAASPRAEPAGSAPQTTASPEPPSVANPPPASAPEPTPRRASTTLVPPVGETTVVALPFRSSAPSFDTIAERPADEATATWADFDDAEVTPPRGHTLPVSRAVAPAPRASPAPAASSPPGRPSMPPVTERPPPPTAPEAAPPSQSRDASCDPAVAAAARREAWSSQEPIAQVLARRGVDPAAFRAALAAEAAAIASEATEGGSARAIALVERLARAT